MKRKILSLGMAVIMMFALMAAAGCSTKPEYTPTFMYFVSNSDENKDEALAVVNELQKEYDGMIKFDIHNIDETPEDKENFPVDGMTPALIMLNTNNDISAMEFQCADKDKLKSDIENAVNGAQ